MPSVNIEGFGVSSPPVCWVILGGVCPRGAGDQGSRVATSVGGVLTGWGADIIVIDDPLKPEEALSQAQRQAANEWFDHTLYSRLNDKLRGAIVLIMHRLHEDDLAGHVLEQEPWEVVRLPALADEAEAYRVETVLGQQSFGRT